LLLKQQKYTNEQFTYQLLYFIYFYFSVEYVFLIRDKR